MLSSFSVLPIREPHPTVVGPVRMLKDAIPVVLPIDPLPLVVAPVGSFIFTEAVTESALVGSLVMRSVRPALLSVSMR